MAKHLNLKISPNAEMINRSGEKI